MNIRRLSIIILVLVLCTAHCCRALASQLSVVTTTTLIGSLVREVGGTNVRAKVLISGASCPGQYDMRPGDVSALRHCGALIFHGYEQFVPNLVKASQSKALIVPIGVDGNWLVPNTCLKAVDKIAESLGRADPSHRSEYAARLTVFVGKIRRMERLPKVGRGTAVICSDQQSQLLEWLGFKVVGKYGRPEDLTPQELHKLFGIAREQKVSLVVDNLQSGPQEGVQLARAVHANHIVLSSFPEGFPGTGTWESTLRSNINRVVEAVKESNAIGNTGK